MIDRPRTQWIKTIQSPQVRSVEAAFRDITEKDLSSTRCIECGEPLKDEALLELEFTEGRSFVNPDEAIHEECLEEHGNSS